MVRNERKPVFGGACCGDVPGRVFRPDHLRGLQGDGHGDRQFIAIRMTDRPEAIFSSAVAVAEERGARIEKRDDKEFFLSGKTGWGWIRP